MVTKHFFKVLAIFILMIVLALIGVFVVNRFGQDGAQATIVNNKTAVAK